MIVPAWEMLKSVLRNRGNAKNDLPEGVNVPSAFMRQRHGVREVRREECDNFDHIILEVM